MRNTHRIVSAATLMNDGLIVPGVRHYSPDMRAVLKRIYGDGYHMKTKAQGFIDTHGNFLTRNEAYNRVLEIGQVGEFIGCRVPDTTTELFSEDLY